MLICYIRLLAAGPKVRSRNRPRSRSCERGGRVLQYQYDTNCRLIVVIQSRQTISWAGCAALKAIVDVLL